MKANLARAFKVLAPIGLSLALVLPGWAEASIDWDPGLKRIHGMAAEVRLKHSSTQPEFEDSPKWEKIEEVFTIFPTQDAALEWARRISPTFQLGMGAQRFAVVSSTDPRYPILKSYLHKTWEALVGLFPEQAAGLPEPQLVLIDSERVNAMVPGDIESGKIANAVMVLT
jgi:hypothetical protein